MAEEKPKDEPSKDERNRDDTDPDWEGFRDYVKRIAAVPKEELNKKLAKEKRGKEEEKRAG